MGADSDWAWEINVSNQVNFKIFAGNIEEKLSYILGGVCEIYREVLEIFLIVRTTINVCMYMCISDQISRSVVSDSLRPHESQHARSPCPLPTPGVHSDSRPSSQ